MDKYADDFRKEIDIMQELEHENIVKFHGIFRGGKPSITLTCPGVVAWLVACSLRKQLSLVRSSCPAHAFFEIIISLFR